MGLGKFLGEFKRVDVHILLVVVDRCSSGDHCCIGMENTTENMLAVNLGTVQLVKTRDSTPRRVKYSNISPH